MGVVEDEVLADAALLALCECEMAQDLEWDIHQRLVP